MKRLILVLLALAAFAPVVQAQEQSVTFSPLLQSARFLDRVEFNVVKWIDAPAGAGVGPMLEATSVPCHNKRIQLARDFLNESPTWRLRIARHLITQTVILSGGSLTGSGATLDSPATDAALFSAISASWSVFAACDVNNS